MRVISGTGALSSGGLESAATVTRDYYKICAPYVSAGRNCSVVNSGLKAISINLHSKQVDSSGGKWY